MKVNLQEVFAFPLKDKNWIVKIFLGGLFILGGFFIVPLLFPAGYIVKIMREAINKQDPVLPEWKDWEGFLRDGFFIFVIVLAYLVPYFILTVIVMAVFYFIAEIIPLIGFLAFLLVKLIGFLAFFLGFSPLVSIAICLYLGTSELSSAFQLQKIIEIFKKGITEYIIISIIGLSLVVVSFVLGITVILIPLIPFAIFYVKVVIARMYSEAFIKYAEEAEESTLSKPTGE